MNEGNSPVVGRDWETVKGGELGNALKLKQSAIGRAIKNHYKARDISNKGLFGEGAGREMENGSIILEKYFWSWYYQASQILYRSLVTHIQEG